MWQKIKTPIDKKDSAKLPTCRRAMKRISLTLLSLTAFTNMAQADGNDIDRVLSELNRQHDTASSLVRSVREPLSLSSSLSTTSKKSTTGTGDDILSQLTAVASSTVSRFKQAGLASWYGRQFHGKKTASGETFDMNALTAAHPSLPMNCYIKVTNKDNGESVVVRVNDRSPLQGNRVLDLSYGAAKAIGITQKGTGNVTIERVDTP